MNQRYKKQQILSFQSEVPRYLYQITDGYVRLYSITDAGNERTLDIFGPGDMFPLTWALGLSPVSLYNYETFTNVDLIAYRPSELSAVLADAHELIHKQMARNEVTSLMKINALSQDTARDVVLRLLHYLVLRFGDHTQLRNWQKIVIPLTQQDIANMTSLARETVAVILKDLKDQKIITVRQKYYSLDMESVVKRIEATDFEVNLEV